VWGGARPDWRQWRAGCAGEQIQRGGVMVYWLGTREIFETSTGTSIIDGDDRSLARVQWMNPDEIDKVSKLSPNEKMTSGYKIDTTTVPKKMRWESMNRIPPDIEKSYGSLIISEQVRDIIETFEPNVHQMLPVDLYRPKANDPFVRYYWLVVCNRIDSVDAEHSTFRRMGRNNDGMWESGGDETLSLIFSRSQIAGRHMWIDPFLGSNLRISDQLGAALIAAEITGAALNKYQEI
jgi:hypothetical protein